MNQNFSSKFSENLRKVLLLGEKIANDSAKPLDSEDLLLAITHARESLANDVLAGFNLTTEKIEIIAKLISPKNSKSKKRSISHGARSAIKNSIKIATHYNHSLIDVEHLLLSLLSDKKYNSYQIIDRAGTPPEKIVKQIESIFSEISKVSENIFNNFQDKMQYDFPPEDDAPPFAFGAPTISKSKSEKSFLSEYTIDLTKLASENMVDPLIGREEEIDRIFQILGRRTKNNPLLLGDPGVGKTAIIEGLAKKIFIGECPKNLIGKKILSLDISSLVAGTIYRGQFEGRMKKLISELGKVKDKILFIDEIHTTIGSGSAEGSLDVANILKPILSRGEIQIIGATTYDEYKKQIEKDPAYERRFQLVKIDEPTIEETIKILIGLKKRYEIHHNVKITEDAVQAAAELSEQYLSDRFLPDKAIDLIDEAASSTNYVSSENVALAKIKSKLDLILRQKESAVTDENYELATGLREEEIILTDKISKIEKTITNKRKRFVDSSDIAQIISKQTGIEVENLTENKRKRYLGLENKLKKFIIGQNEAVSRVAKSILRNRAGVSDPLRPVGSFLFLGPTGAGKTYLAKILAKIIFGSENALIKIDMSEFMERHNVSRLIGAPAGYVGYDEGGGLTEKVRHKPNSVIVFDEIEKAHPDTFNILLQILEDGYLTDAKGRQVNFRNTIIILTSNLGTKEARELSIGFNQAEIHPDNNEGDHQQFKEKIHEILSDEIPPELLNRFDQIVVFRSLDKNSILKIVELQTAEIIKRLKKQGLALLFSNETKKYLAEVGFSEEHGARQVRRAITENIEDPLSEALIAEKYKKGEKIKIELIDKKIVLK
ncbi:MAG: ATP-dependent Clp protease [Candidatus Berkelbacteria bacterium Athens1014_28]|uniref:ATP-dependent Clp protease n=1 Tax=Candidatus Berkelbacteria bacterium Athens1014_28 TaxID=2017145 RepID=A0A554LPL4_9BACT|nr:MAG: ATP-dependent Clp protease [Candidatus Berkelbacteria bacterium Athens1014_28]